VSTIRVLTQNFSPLRRQGAEKYKRTGNKKNTEALRTRRMNFMFKINMENSFCAGNKAITIYLAPLRLCGECILASDPVGWNAKHEVY
jgi:hypothetical protein